MSKPYYNALLSQSKSSTKAFKQLLEKYPKLIFMSGHTHEDFTMNYNFSDENGKACSMIHVPCLSGTTMPDDKDTDRDYNDGIGYNSQGFLCPPHRPLQSLLKLVYFILSILFSGDIIVTSIKIAEV